MSAVATEMRLAWGHRVSLEFISALLAMCRRLDCNPNYVMAVMAFETGERFTSDVRNPVSGAVGLIQFMASTAKGLGVAQEQLAAMTPLQQLTYVEKHLPCAGRFNLLLQAGSGNGHSALPHSEPCRDFLNCSRLRVIR